MNGKIVWAINVILLLIIIVICAWAFPYAASAFYMSRGHKAFEAAQGSPDGLELYARALGDLRQAVRWDENNAEAIELLPQAGRQLAQVYVEEGRFVEVRPVFEAMLEQDAENQFALYYLARIYEEEGETEQAAEIYRTLHYFELEEGGKPPAYLGGLVAKLEQYGVWELEQVVNVASYLVWQGAREQAEELLNYLGKKYPDEPDWPFYRGELYHRQGDLERAEAMYWQALAADAEYVQAYLRLGMVSESANQRVEAAKWYERYYDLAPDDLLGLKRLVEVCAVLEDPSTGLRTGAEVEDESCGEAATLREELEARTDDRRIVAELLDVPVESVELGPNLVENGGFEIWKEGWEDGWQWANWATGNTWNLALFVGGVDELGAYEGGSAMRVDGIWAQRKPDLAPARAGYWGVEQEIESNTPYVISFEYLTKNVKGGKPAIWVSETEEVFFKHDHVLPCTNGFWRKLVIVGWGRREGTNQVRWLLRSWGVGETEFDGLGLKRISLAADIRIKDYSIISELR